MKPIDILKELDSNEAENLKYELQKLADRDFYNEMRDNMDFRLDDELYSKIQNIIETLEKCGITVCYKDTKGNIQPGYHVGCEIIYKERR